MAIDMPPVVPPELVDSQAMKTYVSQSPRNHIERTVGNARVRVIGDEYLQDENIERVLAAAGNPSQAIRNLNKLYRRSGHLLVRLLYTQMDDAVYVYVLQTRLDDIVARHSIRVHFDDLIGDPDLKVEEFDEPRVLANLKSNRSGVDYSISYEFGDNPESATMVFEPVEVKDHESTDFYLDASNQGNRFVGRYFAGAGITHRFSGGSEIDLRFQKALVGLGETQGGKSYDNATFNWSHPSRWGLYGVELVYASYEREADFFEATSALPVDSPDTQQCLDPDATICVPSADDSLGLSETRTDTLAVEGETAIAALTGEQVLFSHPDHRMILSQRAEWVEDEVDTDEQGVLLDEVYGSVELGLEYRRNSSLFGASTQFQLKGTVKGGVTGDRGTLGQAGSAGDGNDENEDGEEDADIVTPGKRTAEFIAVRPKLGYKIDLARYLRLNIDASGQIVNDRQVPQQQQYVLGGIDMLSAYLPGVLIGDTGAYGRLSFEGINLEIAGTRIVPSVFAEYGATRFENAGASFDDVRAIGDAGARLTLRFASGVDMEFVAAESVAEKNLSRETLENFGAEFFWKVRATF